MKLRPLLVFLSLFLSAVLARAQGAVIKVKEMPQQ